MGGKKRGKGGKWYFQGMSIAYVIENLYESKEFWMNVL